MFLQEITHEQVYLQNLWSKFGFAGQVAYASKQGWWVIRADTESEKYDVVFLGQYVQDAQQSIKSWFNP